MWKYRKNLCSLSRICCSSFVFPFPALALVKDLLLTQRFFWLSLNPIGILQKQNRLEYEILFNEFSFHLPFDVETKDNWLHSCPWPAAGCMCVCVRVCGCVYILNCLRNKVGRNKEEARQNPVCFTFPNLYLKLVRRLIKTFFLAICL